MQRRHCRYDLLFLFPSFIIFEAMFVLYGFGETYKRMNSQTHFCVSQTMFFVFVLFSDFYSSKILWAYSLLIIFWSPRHITRLPRLLQLCQVNWYDSYKRFSCASIIFAAKACDVSFLKLLFRKIISIFLINHQPPTIIFRWLSAQNFSSDRWLV